MNLTDRIFGLLQPSVCYGIEVTREGSGYKGALAKISGPRQNLKTEYLDGHDLPEAVKKTDKGAFISVYLHLGSIIKKRVAKQPQEQGQAVFERVFPTLKKEDVFYEIADTGEHWSISLVARKEIEEIVEIFSAQGRYIYNLFIGKDMLASPGRQSVIQFPDGKELQVDRCWDDSTGHNIRSGVFVFDGQRLPAVSFRAVLTAYRVFDPNGDATAHEMLAPWRESFRYSVFTRKIVSGAFVLVFLLLTANFFVFSSVNERHAELEAQYALLGGEVEEFRKLENEIGQKEQLVKKYNLNNAAKFSYYSDQVAVLLPPSIRLESMEVFPLTFDKKGGSKAVGKLQKEVVITGISTSDMDFHNWVRELKSQGWIAAIDIENFQKVKNEEHSEFHIVLSVG